MKAQKAQKAFDTYRNMVRDFAAFAKENGKNTMLPVVGMTMAMVEEKVVYYDNLR
jgi:hypothetical protein